MRSCDLTSIFNPVGGLLKADDANCFEILAGLILLLLLTIAGGYIWYTHRPLPAAVTDQPLFEGITYTRVLQTEPLPLIYHVVRVDLTTPDLHFLVTPADERSDDYVYSARTTSDFLREFGVQLALNLDGGRPIANHLGIFAPPLR